MRSLAFVKSVLILGFAFSSVLFASADKLKPEDIVAKYLSAVGTPEARAAAKSRFDRGSAHFRILVGGAGTLDGSGVFVSEGRKSYFQMKFPNTDYRGEQFVFDGNKLQVAASTARQGRSTLGEFVYTQDVIVKDGLWGGELSTAFPLLNLEEHKAKLSFEGEKNVDGRQLLDVVYKPKKSTDLEIHLYFEPDTYRHVMTTYSLRVATRLGNVDAQISNAQPTGDVPGQVISTGGVVTESSETASARQHETRIRLEERFSDFKTVDGLTLPSHYNLHFSQELGNGHTSVNEWDVTTDDVHHNVPLDPKNLGWSK